MPRFFSRQPIALPLDIEHSMSEKEPLTLESELPAQPTDSESSPPTSRWGRCKRNRCNDKSKSKSKFRKAVVIIFRLFMITSFLRWASHKLHSKFGHHHGDLGHHNVHELAFKHPVDMEMFIQDNDFECDSAAKWSDPEEIDHPHHFELRFSSDTSFTLPRTSESLLFLAQGSYSYGVIEFTEDDTDSLTSSQIGVYINVRYDNEEALEQAAVCTIVREAGDGIGFFTPTEKHRGRRHDELRFNVTVKFPKSSSDETSIVENLETSLPLFAHHFPKTGLQFKTLSVKSANMPIHAESLIVTTGEVKTTNSPIKGSFTVTDTLELITVNSPVKVNVTMYNTDEEESTNLVIRSSNSPIKSNITLISTSSESTGGEFIVDAQTSNSPLVVHFPVAPVDSVLQFAGKTSNSPAFAHLPSTFEGNFHVKSSIFSPKVDVIPDVEDPKGSGRERKVEFSKAGKEILGSVRWSGEDDDGAERKGFAELFTSVLGARLVL